MRTIHIPNSDLNVSAICLGTGDLGGGVNQSDSFQLLDAYTAAGGTFIDTAHIYNDWIPGERNRSEKTIGAWIQARKNRANIVLSTKGAHPELSSMTTPRMSRQEIFSDLDSSLQNLRTDCIDLYWLHRDDTSRPVAEILETLNEAQRAGKIRFFGASNWHAPRLIEAQTYAAQHALAPFTADQMLWNAAKVDFSGIPDQTIAIMDADLYNYHLKSGLAIIPYTSQAGGLFNHLAQGAAQRLTPERLKQYPLAENTLRFQRMQKVSAETGLSITQIVLGWLLSQPVPTIPIIGCKSQSQLADSLTAADVQLTPDQLHFIAPMP